MISKTEMDMLRYTFLCLFVGGICGSMYTASFFAKRLQFFLAGFASLFIIVFILVAKRNVKPALFNKSVLEGTF